MSDEKSYALEIEDLNVEYHVDKEVVHALNGVSFKVAKGDKVAQIVVAPVARAEIVESAEVDETERGAGGFGSTGV